MEILTALVLLFILYAGLAPFDFLGHTPPIGEVGDTSGSVVPGGLNAFFTALTDQFTFPDAVANIFLYIPLGWLVHVVLCRRRLPGLVALLLTIIAAGVLSGGIEWIQAFSPSRVSSIIDLGGNLTGATLGALISWFAKAFVPRFIGAAMFELHAQPTAVLLKAYIFALVVVASMPFSFSFDATRFGRQIKSAYYVPFSSIQAFETQAQAARTAHDPTAHAYAQWHVMKRCSRWAAESASFVVLAWLLQSLLIRHYGFGWRAAGGLVCWMGAGLAVGLSLLQLLVITRGLDTTDIVFRMVGLIVGLATGSAVLPARGLPSLRIDSYRQLARIGCIVTAGYILYTGVIPLVLDPGAASPSQVLASAAFLPFHSYFETRFDLMMADVMEKCASFALFSALLVAAWPRAQRARILQRIALVGGVGIGLSTAIELFQAYIPVRVTSLTDPILAACGCVVGVVVQEHALTLYRSARSLAEEQEIALDTESLGLTDALIATLAEPSATAPREPSPAPAPEARQ